MKSKFNFIQFLIFCILSFGFISNINFYIYKFYKTNIIYISLIIYALCLVKAKYNKELYNNIVYLSLYFLLLFAFSLSIRDNHIGYIINYMFMIFFHNLLKIYGFEKKYIITLIVIAFIVCIYISIISPNYSNVHYESIISGDNNIINTNLISFNLLILSFFIVSFLTNFKFNNFYKITLIIFIFGINIYSIGNLSSRSSYISILFLILFILFYPKKLLTKKITLFLFIIFILSNIIIPIIYVHMYKNGIEFNQVGSIHKNTFTGREKLWVNYLSQFHSIKDYFIGLGSNYGFGDCHNSTLTIFKTGGLTLLFLIYGYFFVEINKSFSNSITKNRFIFIICFFISFISSCFESILLSPQVYLILMLLLYEFRFNKTDEYQ